MKSFLKYTLATIVGLIIVHFVLFILLISIIGTISILGSPEVIVRNNSVLHIKLEDGIKDRTSNNPLDNIDLLNFDTQEALGLKNILSSIEYAANDPKIIGIYMDLDNIWAEYGTLATIEEIRSALKKFKASGKFIYSYSNLGYTQASYFLATAANKVYVNPESPLLLNGISSNITMLKESMEKLGVQAEVVKVGKFKSAVEPYIDTEISKANREQIEKYLNSSWGTIVQAISTDRNIPEEEINRITDQFNIYPPEQFKSWGFFDDVLYEDQMLELLKQKCKQQSNDSIYHLVDIADYQFTLPSEIYNDSPNEIAIVYAQGEIGTKQSNSSIGPKLAETIRSLRDNDKVKAIVLRVNSPGGSALVSDLIWRETALAQQKKPLIVSMGNVAASGGYYISCAADTIVAEATTLTGSIGIFGLFFSGEELIKDKLGIHTSTVKTNEHSDFGGSYPLPLPISTRPLTPYEKGVMQNYVNKGYETFLQRVMDGRGLSREAVDSIAQGRVWTGIDALQIGLVDAIGGLEDAIRIAVHKADLVNYQIKEYPELDPLEELMGGLTLTIKSNIVKEELGILYPIWSKFKNISANQGILARIPYDLTIQ